MKKLLTSVALVISGFALLAGPVFASSSVIYNNGLTDPLPGNVPSEGPEAYGFKELGGQVQFAGTERSNPKVTVLMSSWACQAGSWVGKDCVTDPTARFTHPITLNVYNVNEDNTPGSLITSSTQEFAMPYRPSADNVNCTDVNAGKWFDGTSCKNGLAFPIVFDLTGTTLPDKAILSVAYNTSHHGYNPIGETSCNVSSGGCFYDSLNIGLGYSILAGTAPLPNDIYQNANGYNYCDSGSSGVNTFRLDAGCWTGYQPTFKVEAETPDNEAPVLTFSGFRNQTNSGYDNSQSIQSCGSVNKSGYIAWEWLLTNTETDPVTYTYTILSGPTAVGFTMDTTDTHVYGGIPMYGTYGVQVTGKDKAGNVSEPITCSVVYEETPVVVGPPTNKDQCKNDGWKTFNNPTFKNQGSCVSYITSNEKAGKRN